MVIEITGHSDRLDDSRLVAFWVGEVASILPQSRFGCGDDR